MCVMTDLSEVKKESLVNEKRCDEQQIACRLKRQLKNTRTLQINRLKQALSRAKVVGSSFSDTRDGGKNVLELNIKTK